MLAENEGLDGDTSPGRKGNTHLRVRLRSQRKDQCRHSPTGIRVGFAGFNARPKIVHENDCSVTFSTKSHNQARDNPDDNGPS